MKDSGVILVSCAAVNMHSRAACAMQQFCRVVRRKAEPTPAARISTPAAEPH